MFILPRRLKVSTAWRHTLIEKETVLNKINKFQTRYKRNKCKLRCDRLGDALLLSHRVAFFREPHIHVLYTYANFEDYKDEMPDITTFVLKHYVCVF